MSYLEHRSKLQNWDSDIQTPSLECISAESREINKLRKQICWWMRMSLKATRLGWPRCRFYSSSHAGRTKRFKRFPFLLRGKEEKGTTGGKRGKKRNRMELVMRKGRRKWERREKPEEGRGRRQESYDVWTLASHPAERSITPKPASLARSSGDVGLRGSAVLLLTALPDTPAQSRQPRDAQSIPLQPTHPSPPLPEPRSPPTPALDFSPRPHH